MDLSLPSLKVDFSVSKLITQAKKAEIWNLISNKIEVFETGFELLCVQTCRDEGVGRLVSTRHVWSGLDPPHQKQPQQTDALSCSDGDRHDNNHTPERGCCSSEDSAESNYCSRPLPSCTPAHRPLIWIGHRAAGLQRRSALAAVTGNRPTRNLFSGGRCWSTRVHLPIAYQEKGGGLFVGVLRFPWAWNKLSREPSQNTASWQTSVNVRTHNLSCNMLFPLPPNPSKSVSKK